jgi:hypothetical protein
LINRNGKDVSGAAVEATVQLLAKGSSLEHQKLVNANPDILTVALKFHSRGSRREHSVNLLCAIVTHLTHMLLLHEELARKMFSLFE